MKTFEPDMDLAYLAGLFDGEGCICMSRSHGKVSTGSWRYTASADLNMVEKSGPAEFHRRFGGSLWASSRKKTVNGRDQWCWKISAQKLIPFLTTILPLLRVKQRQAHIALALQADIGAARYEMDYPGRGGKKVPAARQALRAKLYDEMRILNSVGRIPLYTPMPREAVEA